MNVNLLKKVVVAILLAIPLVSYSQSYDIVLDEGFESLELSLPDGWTQEFKSGEHSWVIETGGINPIGAYEGEKRIVFRNTSGMTQGYSTMLVLPPLDLSELYQPILCFAHAQPQWTGDYDVLRVYYRTDPDADWILLPQGDYAKNYIPRWRMDTLDLPSTIGVKAYQLAFEATDGMGHGVLLDNIVVRSKPSCYRPRNVFVSDLTNSSVTLNFMPSFDAEEIRVILSATELTSEQLVAEAMNVVADTLIPGYVETIKFDGLEQNGRYFAYVKNRCWNDESDWTEAVEFKVKSLVSMPYHETFDMTINQNFSQRINSWTYGNSAQEYTPYVNTMINSQQAGYYSEDATSGLFFTDASNYKEPIPAGQMAYAATPMIDVDDISSVQISFTGIYHEPTQESWSRRLIVGVMETPNLFETFVPIDTVEITEFDKFRRFIVPMTAYKATGKSGKYIALVSNFTDVPNVFYLDDVVIEAIPKYRVPYELKVSLPSATEAVVSWETYDAVKGDVQVSGMAAQENQDIVTGVKVALTSDTEYSVKARNRYSGGESEWSGQISFRTPGTLSENQDTVFTFETDKIYSVDKPSVSWPVPTLQTGMLSVDNMSRQASMIVKSSDVSFLRYDLFAGSTVTELRSQAVLLMLATDGCHSYVIFPEMGDVAGRRVSFWYAGATSAMTGRMMEAGVLTDAADMSTFKSLKTVKLEDGWQKVNIGLGDHEGAKFFALKIASVKGQGMTTAFVDDVVFEAEPACKEPADIEIEPKDYMATARWDAQGGTEWNVRVTATPVHSDVLESTDSECFVFMADGITKPEVEIAGLKARETEYYFYIRPVCDDGSVAWSAAKKFATICPAFELLPYDQTFDDGSTLVSSKFALPCFYTEVKEARPRYGDYHPYLRKNPDWKTTGLSLELKRSYYNTDDIYLALPVMGDVDIKDLVMTFETYTNNNAYVLAVGVMSDPTDVTTFDTVQTIMATALSKWEKHKIAFAQYEGNGKHIAFITNSYFNIDNIHVNTKPECFQVSNLLVTDVTERSAYVRWEIDKENKWDLIISKNRQNMSMLTTLFANPTSDIRTETVNTMPYIIDDLDANTTYYFYVRANCGAEKTGEWAEQEGSFTTLCNGINVGDESMYNFDNEIVYRYGVGPACWRVYNGTFTYNIPYCEDTKWSHSQNGALSFNTLKSSTGHDAYAVMPRIITDDIRTLQVSFWGSCQGFDASDYAHRLIVGVATSAFDMSTFVPVDTVIGYDEEQHYVVSFENYGGSVDGVGKSGDFIVFRSSFDKENHFFIDDVRVDMAEQCHAPKIDVVDIATDKVTINLSGNADECKVVLAERKLTSDELSDVRMLAETEESVVLKNVISNSVVIDGLEKSTTYYIYASGVCNGVELWSNYSRITTNCLEIELLPFEENFEKAGNIGDKPNCWTCFCREFDKYPTLNGTGNCNSERSVRLIMDFPSYKNLLITPELQIIDINELQVSFSVRGEAGLQRSVIVGTVGDITDADKAWETFVPIDTILFDGAEWQEFTVPLASAVKDNSADRRVVFTSDYEQNIRDQYGRKGGFVDFDDIRVEFLPSCPYPTNIALTDRTAESVTISFADMENVEKWEIQYGETGFEFGKGTVKEFNPEQPVITGLLPGTTYDIYLRVICGKGDESRWSAPFACSTLPVILSGTSQVIDFEDDADNLGWMIDNGSELNQWFVGKADIKGENRNALYISNDKGTTAALSYKEKSVVWAYRSIELKPGIYNFKYDYVCYDNRNNKVYIEAGLVPAATRFAAGSNVLSFRDGSSLRLDGQSGIKYGYGPEYYTFVPENRGKLSGNDSWTTSTVTIEVDDNMAGTYLMFFMLKGEGTSYGMENPASQYAAVDNIVVDYNPCFYPKEVEVSELTSSEATFSWVCYNIPDAYEVRVLTDNVSPDDATDGQIFESFLTNDASVDVTGLEAGEQYYVYVRSKCGESYSGWSDLTSFVTYCSLYPSGHKFTFEGIETYLPSNINAFPATPLCFVAGHDNNDAISSYDNTAFFQYVKGKENAHAPGIGALKLDAVNSSKFGAYLALPRIDADLDTMMVSFWMRPVYEYSSSSTVSQVPDGNANRITVGTMTNPYDPATFRPIRTVVYPYSYIADRNIDADVSGERYWVKASVSLHDAEGEYIAIKCDGYGDFSKNVMYIDDIEVISSQRCNQPYDLKVDNITSHTATLTFAHAAYGTDWEVLVSSDVQMGDTVFFDTVHSGTVELENLLSDADMFVNVRQLCDDGKYSDWSSVLCFHTACDIRFFEGFEVRQRVPDGWILSMEDFRFTQDDIFSEDGYMFEHVDMVSTRSDLWNYDESTGLSGGHAICNPTSPTTIVSPQIYINDGTHAHLTFDLALTSVGTSNPITDKGNKTAEFVVAVSEDDGKHWKREHATVWDNSGNGDYLFDGISVAGERVRIDLSAHNGKVIRVALFCNYRNGYVNLHVDNFCINYFELDERSDELCESQDYFVDGFELMNADIESGKENLRVVYTRDEIGNDTVYSRTILVTPLVERTIEKSVCSGDVYTDYGFYASVSGRYKRKEQSSNGCDSVTILDLTVINIPEIIEYDTICQGGSVVWHGKVYNRPGLYTDTLHMQANDCHCDSIVSLALHVTGALLETDDVTLCYGDSIEIGGLGFIKKTGLYRDTVKIASGNCDSIIEVKVTVKPQLVTVKDTVICLGEYYEDDIFVGGYDETGSYDMVVKTPEKCDSTVILNLIVLNPYNPVKFEHNISRDELPYEFYGKVFDVNTPDGTYTETVHIASDDCEGDVELVLSIGDKSVNPGIRNLYQSNRLIITPNPVRSGEEVTIHLDLATNRRTPVTVQVYSSTGIVLQNFESESSRIILSGLTVSGVYMVRITDNEGRRYHGKVIVK